MVAPLTNPIQAPPLGEGENVESRMQAQEQALDPGAVGQNLHNQQVAQPQPPMPSPHDAAVASTLAQTQAAMAEISRELRDSRAPVADPNTAPTLGPLDPAQYEYSPEVLAQLGDTVPGAIDRRSEFHARNLAEQALQRATEYTQTQIAGMQTKMDALAAENAQLRTGMDGQFETQARMAATTAGLDLMNPDADPVWAALMAEKADAVTGRTFKDYVDSSIASKNGSVFNQVLAVYGQRKAAQPAAPGVSPVLQPGGASLPAGQGGAGDMAGIQQEIQTILGKKQELQSQRMRTQISNQQFQQEAEKLQGELQALQEKLSGAAAA